MVVVGALFAVVSLARYAAVKNAPSSALVAAAPAAPAPTALPQQETVESVFEAVRAAMFQNDIERIKQLMHPDTLASVGDGAGPRWEHWVDTLKVQMADAEIKNVTRRVDEGVEWADATVLLYPPNRSSAPREGHLRFLKVNGSWYWAER